MLSDHVFHLFGRSISISGPVQLALVIVFAAGLTAWVMQQFRRRRVVVLHRSAVSDQVLYELSRIADSLDRISSRPVDQVTPANFRAEPAKFRAEESRDIPLSMFGRERPHS